MKKLSLSNLDVKNKKVLMRVDFNVPLDKNGAIVDDTRIKASLPSIEFVIQHKGKLILMSHLGKPDGKIDPKLSLEICAKKLSQLLQKPVFFATDCIGEDAQKKASELKKGEVLLLENLRFHPGEEHPDAEKDFVQKLAHLGDCYVNDAFGTAHRAHSSTALITQFFPNQSAAGFLIEKEITHLAPLLDNPIHPYFALIGGAKISSKLGVLKSLLPKVDRLFIGGAMANTFLQALDYLTGKSLVEPNMLQEAKELLKNKKLCLPDDLLIANAIDESATFQTISFPSNIPDKMSVVDIGPKTVQNWSRIFLDAKTFFWNGPVGIFEIKKFSQGTKNLAIALSKSQAKVVVGGGDSVAAIEQTGLSDQFYHLSTGGGASLEWIEFGHLPGIDALSDE